MKFGLVKTSMIDYPGHIAAALFTRGCNLRCPYCHNPGLVTGGGDSEDMLNPDEVLRFLAKRKNVLEGVCVSGGEPLLYPGLADFIREVRAMGYKVKLDTNGLLPGLLQTLTVDYIALDIKTLPEKYAALLAPPARDDGAAIAEAVRESAGYVIQSGVDHELRSTAAPGIFLEEDIPALAGLVRGCRRYILAAMRPGLSLDPAYGEKTLPYAEETLNRMRRAFRERGVECYIRGGSPEGPE